MAAQAVIPGDVNGAGCFEPLDPRAFASELRARAGLRIEVVLRAPKSKRSLEMNAYLHCENGPFRLLAEHFGETIEGVKYALMGECFGWMFSAAAGREIPVKAHTSDMTIEESAYFVDWVIPWAAQNHGVLIPLPGEVE